ncbi:hypothetical protein HRI_002190800 [Hibiscus trionum]|uniref:RNase H type-1 domain-containing protein n=1 Tax=Hibiscus trionum TaxID=183268 RepID=A0A9W7HVP3_HIBTR|nr:hypothetical protein HRI_002190800 [Hibiscus trionum]
MASDFMDFCVWHQDPCFSISKAYDILMKPTCNPSSSHWKIIWQLVVSQRVRLFLWLAFNAKLLNNQERHRRTFAASAVCSLCNDFNESVVHSLCDCVVARAVWDQINPIDISPNFYRYDQSNWILHNLKLSTFSPTMKTSWNITFAAFCWHIWKARNDQIFNDTRPSSSTTSHRSMTCVTYYASCKVSAPPRVLTMSTIQWSSPPAQWVALYTDGATCLSIGFASIGGLLRNNFCTWLLGFNRGISVIDAFKAKLWAIHEGLCLAWNHGFELIQVQSDLACAISAINATDAHASVFPLARAISALQNRGWAVDFLWIPREANHAAVALAKYADHSSFSLMPFDYPSFYVQILIARDVDGPPYCKTSVY